MAIGVGIDIGCISVKVAVLGSGDDRELVDKLVDDKLFFKPEGLSSEYAAALSLYTRIKGRPLDTLDEFLGKIREVTGNSPFSCHVTGSGAKLLNKRDKTPTINEFSAISEAVRDFYPEVSTVFEMGGETSKYILLGKTTGEDELTIIDYGTNGDCAAGTGSFMDQQAGRLKFRIEDVGSIINRTSKSARIAGRCSVFAKSDMIHAQQRGYSPEEVLKGLCDAVARNFKSAITRSRKIIPPVIFMGGVSQNEGMLNSLREVFGLEEEEISVPETACWLSALGCAAISIQSMENEARELRLPDKTPQAFYSLAKLNLENVSLLRERILPFTFEENAKKVSVYMGVDVGSVSTNLVVIDTEGKVIKEIYTRTNARPIEVVAEGLQEIENEIGEKVEIRGVGTTGSGRELIGILIGADTVNDEITAHKTGALHISRKMLDSEVDTIFEIGGQDSKYISIDDNIVVDFTMNDACAAGTGSFLEEQAEQLGVKIIGEFSELAFTSEHPIKMGERCTVFMGRDVNSYLQKGASKQDIIAGLAYSVVYNYLNRVVSGRKIGDTIFFQGGTAYNDSVAAAFSLVTGKRIIVPPYNGVIGAVGAALLAKRKMEVSESKSTFRGFNISDIDYKLREFICQGCSNFCNIQEFTVDGEKTFWGDKCSDRYRKQKKIPKEPVLKDLFKTRDEILQEISFNDNEPEGPVIGIPFTMYSYDRLPFYANFLRECGFRVVLSESTNNAISNKGIELVVAEPCYPIIVAHGHIKSLIEKNVDYIWLPNIINSENEFQGRESFACVWASTLPFISAHNPEFASFSDRILKPTIHFMEGSETVTKELWEEMKKFNLKRAVVERAVTLAFEAQEEFRSRLYMEGEEALRVLNEKREKGIILIGRPYNIYDRAINLSLAKKLSGLYGINVIPLEFIDVRGISIDHINNNMYWAYGRRILQAAVKFADQKNIDFIYVTNFKCGPDSFIKQYVQDAIGRPFLMLQFDGHSNDAGMLTRCEAYLDSKGFLNLGKQHALD